MTRRTATIVMVLLGAAMLVVVAGVAATAWMFVSVLDQETVSEAGAARAFDEVRQQFEISTPVIELRDGTAVVVRKPPDAPGSQRLRHLVVLAWDANDGKLFRATVPFWLIRLKDGPFELSVGGDAPFQLKRPVSVTVEEIERYGPALIVDERHGTDRLLVWTE